MYVSVHAWKAVNVFDVAAGEDDRQDIYSLITHSNDRLDKQEQM